MKKMLLLILLTFGSVNVFAANQVAKSDDANFNTLKTQYNKGIQKTTINGSGIVTLYGYSSCQTGSCAYKYANTNKDFKEVLKEAVSCAGGEKHIIYQTTGGADGYKDSNSENYVGDVYWSEDFNITCTNTQTTTTVQLENTVTEESNTGSGDGYTSSDTTENDSKGVETYYIILTIVGLITYFITRVIKKQNLFKNI